MDEEKLTEQVEEEVRDSEKAKHIVALYEKNKGRAHKLLQDTEKMDHFLVRLERKFRRIPLVGDQLAVVPAMIQLINSYRDGEYPELPLGAIISVVGTLLYLVAPIDVLPDGIPFLGYTDDVALIAIIWKLISDDVEEYHKWRKKNNKERGE